MGYGDGMTTTISQPTTDAKLIHDGWDGRSNPMYVLVDPCGCRWTSGRSIISGNHSRLRTCTACLSRACCEQVAR